MYEILADDEGSNIEKDAESDVDDTNDDSSTPEFRMPEVIFGNSESNRVQNQP